MNGDLSETLRRTRDALRAVRGRFAAAALAADVLERDLLPRSAGGDAYLVAGIVGPNNAGKSALFNALVGRDLSPSVPTGGATRRLVGAAHPSLLAQLRAEPTLARFRLRSFAGETPSDEPLRPAADPTELLVAEEPQLPPQLMLIDTPDFDSILEDNRVASESLLAVADLVLVVVTRHSYQNHAVVRFLERWLQHGRPWMLVYNEATDGAVASAHAGKLAGDVGTPPLAAFWAPHSLAVQEHRVRLDPTELSTGDERSGSGARSAHRERSGRGRGGGGDEPSTPPVRRLRDLLVDAEQIASVKTRAFAAALGRLRNALGDAARELDGEALRSSAVLAAAEARALETGTRIAEAAMPAQPFVDAFRTVLDRRSNALSRGWRTALRRVRLGIERLLSPRRGHGGVSDAAAAVNLPSIEREELVKHWSGFWEELVRDLGHEARHAARRTAGAALAARLDVDLADTERASARARAEGALGMAPAEVAEFQRACEQLVEKAIEERGFDLDIQAAADLATLMPIALAAVVIVHTGGLGSDIAALGGGAVGTFLFEKYAHVLGGGILAEARRRWTEVRGRQLAQSLTDAVLPTAAPELRASASRDAALASELRGLEAELGR